MNSAYINGYKPNQILVEPNLVEPNSGVRSSAYAHPFNAEGRCELKVSVCLATCFYILISDRWDEKITCQMRQIIDRLYMAEEQLIGSPDWKLIAAISRGYGL